MSILRYKFSLAFLALWLTAPVFAHEITVQIEAGKVDRHHSPVALPIQLPEKIPHEAAVTVELADGKKVPGQITHPHLLSDAKTESELNFILPELAAGKTLTAKVTIADAASPAEKSFSWHDTPGESMDLTFGDRKVMRYMYAKLDESSKENRHATMKVYHHVFDPTGEKLVTKGPGGLFPHHRGLYFGFNRISYTDDTGAKKTADTWHCNNGEFQSHEKVLSTEAGPVLGRHVLEVAWHGKDGKVFAREARELTAYNVPGGTLIEFATKLNSESGDIELRGDPQHAGFQFRATQAVPDKTAKQTYYLRPDGKGEPGKFRNWPANKEHANLPWNALSFVLDDQRYTCCYLDRPENPKESRYSERDYGRFGSYFEYDLKPEKPLALNYRIWLQEGEMTVEQVQQLDDDFVSPPQVEKKS